MLLYAVGLPIVFVLLLKALGILLKAVDCPELIYDMIGAVFKLLLALGFFLLFRKTIQNGEKDHISVPWFLFCFLYLGIPFFGNAVMAILGVKELKSGSIEIAVAVLSGIAAGIVEEIIFRGVVYNRLNGLFKGKRTACVLAAILSSGVFALCHFANLTSYSFIAVLTQAIYAFAAGMCFCGIYLFSGKLIVTILLHSIVDICANLPVTQKLTQVNSFDPLSLILSSILLVEGVVLILIHQRKINKRGEQSDEIK